ncbi:M20/M25/M40 family metallo-hydrolase [Fulvivirga lutimaris]|uniref:M20/M25/M40 family metallo-hydrolase n=1 Tax=Fulvivirga lutimaris TaxID=1819566 RepID=UPI0012BD69DC|nr:M20/M25/M40 family metallo-hydrolase [Fulvivirga lutimaris]MTI41189.1 M20/M25/M40 family metallo-hydrolase [Fulvivirga lutimaris]
MIRKTLILSLGVAFACTAPEKQTEENIFEKINSEVLQNSEAYSALKEASETIGHRLTGSENGAKAEQFVFDKLKSYGFEDVKFQEFEVEAWSRGTVQLTTNTGGTVDSVASVSLGHSPVESHVTAEIVDMGNGVAADYEGIGDKLKGKIALSFISLLPDTPEEVKNLHRSEKAELAINNGAAGIIIFNQYEGGILLTGTASVTGELLDIPAICIGYEDGMKIKEQLAASPGSVSATIDMTNNSGMIKARNVIATLPGSEISEEKVIVGGHLDSWDLATGAIDNGIGSFAVLDIARTFKANNLQPKRTMQFVFFMGEEQGLFGSRKMVAEAEKDGSIDNIKFMMNLDMSGNPVGMNASGAAIDTAFFASLGEKLQAIDTVYKAEFSSRAGLHSDHQPFMLAGVPILSVKSNLDRSIYKCYHADCDDFDLVNKEHITNTTRFASMMLYEVANAEKLPAVKMNSEETKQFMIDNGLEENLKMQGDWKWGE